VRRAALVATALLLLAACTDDPAAPTAGAPTASSVDTDLMDCPQFTVTSEPVEDGLPPLAFPCLAGDSTLFLGGPVGQPLVLNLWASWCGPCREELPVFEQLSDEAVDQLLVVGLVERDTAASSLAYAAELDLSFPSAIDDTGEFLTEVGLNALPVTYFVRADGTVAHQQLVPITSYDDLLALVDEHLDVTLS